MKTRLQSLAVLITVFAACGTASLPSVAQTAKKDPPKAAAPAKQTTPAPKPTEEKYDNWSLVCQTDATKKKSCFVGQELRGKNDKGEEGRLLRLSFLRQKDKPDFVLVSLLPLGISIPAGAAIVIDEGKQIPMALQSCTNAGCEALLKVDNALMNNLKKGSTLKVGFNAGPKTLVVPVSLKGLTAAIDKIP